MTRNALLCLALLSGVVGCTGTAPGTDPAGPASAGGLADRAREGTVPWDDALLLPGDPTLVTVRFIAGPAGPPTNPCADRFQIDADESSSRVELTIREVPHASPSNGSGNACSLGGVRRYATVQLDGPVGGRSLIDGARNEVRTAVDGTRDLGRAAVRTAAAVHGDAQLSGRLGIDPVTGCLWIDGDDRRTPVLLAHPRYSVRLDTEPPAVHDEDNPTAMAGTQVRLGGAAGSPDDAIPGCPASGPPFNGVLQR